jgi:hypothetical protein
MKVINKELTPYKPARDYDILNLASEYKLSY